MNTSETSKVKTMTVLKFLKKLGFLSKCLEPAFSIVAVRNLTSKQLFYLKNGNPLKVVQCKECQIPPIESEEVLVRMLAASVNPADINTIQGKYPVKMRLPAVPGNEGVGVVEEIGSKVTGLCPGDKVILTASAQGTWRSYGIFHQRVLKSIPQALGTVEAATLCVNPCTAYRMLTDFLPIRKKKLNIIQNGANSACGQNVIQLCKAWDINTVNIVRKRQEHKHLKCYLESLGATYVLLEEEVRKTTIFKDGCIDRPSLALNCVGGKNPMAMVGHLKPAGLMVTYGGMSRQPVMIPTAAFIFKNIALKGFWMTAWNKIDKNKTLQDKMLNELIGLMLEGKLKPPVHKMIKLSSYRDALSNTLNPKGFTGCKYLLDFT